MGAASRPFEEEANKRRWLGPEGKKGRKKPDGTGGERELQNKAPRNEDREGMPLQGGGTRQERRRKRKQKEKRTGRGRESGNN